MQMKFIDFPSEPGRSNSAMELVSLPRLATPCGLMPSHSLCMTSPRWLQAAAGTAASQVAFKWRMIASLCSTPRKSPWMDVGRVKPVPDLELLTEVS